MPGGRYTTLPNHGLAFLQNNAFPTLHRKREERVAVKAISPSHLNASFGAGLRSFRRRPFWARLSAQLQHGARDDDAVGAFTAEAQTTS